MKNIKKFLLYYAAIPFLASLPGLVLSFCGLSAVNLILVPLLAAAIYILLRKKLDMPLSAKVNGLTFVLLLACFTVMMLIAKGNAEGVLMANFSWLILPFAPVMPICMLMGQTMLLYATALLTYLAAFAVSACLGKLRIKKTWLLPCALAAVCLVTSTVLYCNRPSVKYAGHGFAYMHGYSSTDFSNYMVYSQPSKLVTPDHEVSLTIENEADMPKLDGAEACYPLYAAFAKAVYKDIDTIEQNWLEESENTYSNGKIVTFTNSVQGFMRLMHGADKTNFFDDGIDMFFGARPSAEQLQEAKENNVDLTVTPIAKEAFVFFVEADNPVDNLTSEQLKAIYHGDVTNWSEVGGNKQDVLAFQRPQNSGSQTMMEYFMGDVALKEPQTYEMVSAMGGVIEQVAQYANESGAIGYSFRYFLEELNQETGVKMLSIDGVYPSLENIENGSYPLVTNVCLITRANESNPYVQQMIDFILSDAGQDIVKKTGYAGLR